MNDWLADPIARAVTIDLAIKIGLVTAGAICVWILVFAVEWWDGYGESRIVSARDVDPLQPRMLSLRELQVPHVDYRSDFDGDALFDPTPEAMLHRYSRRALEALRKGEPAAGYARMAASLAFKLRPELRDPSAVARPSDVTFPHNVVRHARRRSDGAIRITGRRA